MIRVEPFKPEHLDELCVHPLQRTALERYDSPTYRAQLAAGLSFTMRRGEQILVCGGVLDLYEDRRIGHLWSVLGEAAQTHFLAMHRATARFLGTTGKQLLVATCTIEETRPCKWLRLLGFKFDHIEQDFAQTGEGHAIYVRVS